MLSDTLADTQFFPQLMSSSKEERLVQLKVQGAGGGGGGGGGHQSIRNFAGENLLPVGENRATEKFLKYFQGLRTQIINTYSGIERRELNMAFRSGHFLDVMHTYEYLKLNIMQFIYLIRG